MDGVFMWKLLKTVFMVLLVIAVCKSVGVIEDKTSLHEQVIRLHVVANSDSQEDQALKLQVKDAIVSYLQPMVQKLTDPEQVREFLSERLDELQTVADAVLKAAGSSDRAEVSLGQEAFDTRVYDTFSLPAGVYESLRVEIGNGEGKNWWCVVFPTLCVPASSQGVQDTAAGAGFSEELTGALTGEEGYELRFYLLECIGKLENFFFAQ